MLKDILPDELNKSICLLDYENLCEIRLRLFRPITVNYKNSYYFLGKSGICSESNSLICTREIMQKVLSKASNFSIYVINESLKKGFISVKDGIRIGVTGEIVEENGKIITIKNFSSINIRIPHQIVGCAYKLSRLLIDECGEFQNTLIIGSPGTGKTTILRDLCKQISVMKKDWNILLLDERLEMASCFMGAPQMDVGNTTDIISGGNKSNNILNGVRSMCPNIIVLDEIGDRQDIDSIKYAINTGVKIIASIHSKDIYELQNKTELEDLLRKKAFKRFVVLSNSGGKGIIENIYNESFKAILGLV